MRDVMTDPNDDLSSVADSGVPGDDEYQDQTPRQDEDERGVPGVAADSPAAQGSPVGPPD
jgi:hypothetical protein